MVATGCEAVGAGTAGGYKSDQDTLKPTALLNRSSNSLSLLPENSAVSAAFAVDPLSTVPRSLFLFLDLSTVFLFCMEVDGVGFSSDLAMAGIEMSWAWKFYRPPLSYNVVAE